MEEPESGTDRETEARGPEWGMPCRRSDMESRGSNATPAGPPFQSPPDSVHTFPPDLEPGQKTRLPAQTSLCYIEQLGNDEALMKAGASMLPEGGEDPPKWQAEAGEDP